MSKLTEKEIYVDQLQVGLFIKLKVPWTKHPFVFNSFKIKSKEQIDIIKSLNIDKVIYIPEKSDVEPLTSITKKDKTILKGINTKIKKELNKKIKKIEKFKAIKNSFIRTQKKYKEDINLISNAFGLLSRQDKKAFNVINKVIEENINTIESPNLIMHFIGEIEDDADEYRHALNVMVLSLLIGKAIKLSKKELTFLAIGALLHDIGKIKIEKGIWRKPVHKMSKEEKALVKLHTKYGIEILSFASSFPSSVYDIIYQHHERYLGGGFPRGLKGENINKLARIVGLCNIYDNLSFPYEAGVRPSPFDVIKTIYKKYDTVVDLYFFDILISLIGLCPPGTIVKLNNGMIGKVITINFADIFRPYIMVYDEGIPKEESILLSLSEHTDLQIVSVIRGNELDRKILDYFNITQNYSYYIDNFNNE